MKQKIILFRYRDGYSERWIARELKINRETVRRYLFEYKKARDKLSDGTEPDEALIEEIIKIPRYNSSTRENKKFIDAISQEVDRLLQANEEKRSRGLHKQVMKKIDILEHLKGLGYDIGYTTVCNQINRKLSSRKEAFIRQLYSPGEVCEFDWGEVKLEIGGRQQTLYIAVFTPAMSNYRYAILFHRQDTEAFLQAHVLFFEHIGGVFRAMVYDNMRVAIRRFVGPSEKEPTEALLKLSAYYQFHFRFCNVARGNEKGHVERSVELVRRKAFSGNYRYPSLEAGNESLAGTCNRLNTRFSRDNQGKRPVDLLETEKRYLAPLPPRFDCGHIEQCRVDKYSVITYGTNRYSVPDHLVGRIIDVKVYPEELLCYHDNRKVCQHERQYTRQGWYISLDHYLYTLRRKPGALAGSQALASAPEEVKRIFNKYFDHSPKDFIELLIFLQEHSYDFDKVNEAIDRLSRSSPHDISVDKIKMLCMQNNEEYTPVINDDDQILQQARAQLEELSLLLNY
ncbi:MAG: IS21 family transposase [Bacteroidales bacterium]|jgi:transposase|nr:IS21 family transposase [Bacteroidales bacterium]